MALFRKAQIVASWFAVLGAVFHVHGAGAADGALATVNGQQVTREEIQSFKRIRGEDAAADDVALGALVDLELLAQQAAKLGLAKRPDVQADVTNQRRSILARALIEDVLRNNPVTEADMRALYEQRTAALVRTEYRLRHILTSSRDGADAARAALASGGTFDQVAEQYSEDPSGKQGGELGWVQPDSLPVALSEVVAGASPKQVLGPIQTQLGWHVLLVEDVRTDDPPSFDAAKAQIRTALQNEIIGNYLSQLRERSKINLK